MPTEFQVICEVEPATRSDLMVPEDVLAQIERDPDAGVELACSLVGEIRDSGLFDSVHLIPVSHHRDLASRLERDL